MRGIYASYCGVLIPLSFSSGSAFALKAFSAAFAAGGFDGIACRSWDRLSAAAAMEFQVFREKLSRAPAFVHVRRAGEMLEHGFRVMQLVRIAAQAVVHVVSAVRLNRRSEPYEKSSCPNAGCRPRSPRGRSRSKFQRGKASWSKSLVLALQSLFQRRWRFIDQELSETAQPQVERFRSSRRLRMCRLTSTVSEGTM